MKGKDSDIEAEVKALKNEVNELKEVVKAMYIMLMNDEGEDEVDMRRYNT